MPNNFLGRADSMIRRWRSGCASANPRRDVPLHAFARSNERATVSRVDGALRITTAPQKYAYAAVVNLERLGLKNRVSIRIVARTTEGIASFGVTDRTGTAFLVEKQLQKGVDYSVVDLDIHSATRAQCLVVRSYAEDGRASVAEIREVTFEERERASFEELYAVAGTIRRPPPRKISVGIRTYRLPVDHEAPRTEEDGYYQYESRQLDVSETALFLVDVWAQHPNDGVHKRMAENIENSLAPLLKVARDHQLLTIHLPHARQISAAVAPRPGDVVVFGGDDYQAYEQTYHQQRCDLVDFLEENKMRTLIYAGYATNRCLLHRPAGIIQMAQRGYDCIIVRDCTVAIETPLTLGEEWNKFAAINMIEDQYGGSTTLGDLTKAFDE